MGYRVDPNAKNVWVRDIDDTEDLPLAVNASSVYFNSGKTMEQEFGKGAMSSNVVTVDSGMEKVIDGTYDGAYESCKMYGQTKYIDNTTQAILDGFVEDKDLSLIDVKAPILKNVGKNLFNYNDVSQGSIIWNTPNNVNIFQDVWYEELAYGFRLKECIKVKPNTRYYTNFPHSMHVMKYRINGDLIKNQWNGVATGYFTTTSDTHYINLYPSGGVNADWNEEKRRLFRECFIYEEDAISTYEDYKTNILETSNDLVLRGLPNGIKDSYDCLTGEYVRRVGEIVLNGSEDWAFQNGTGVAINNTLMFKHGVVTMKGLTQQENDSNRELLCDKQKVFSSNSLWNTGEEGISKGLETRDIRFRILKSKLSTEDINGLKLYLQANPITIQYELAEPIVTTIEPSTTPFAYENGHIILESGHEGQSLLPTLEYQTTVSRSGQVSMIDKTIQQHERKITLLEKMLVQNIIDIEYKNTLLALKLEIDEVI